MSSFIFVPNQQGPVSKRKYNKPLTVEQWKIIEDDVRTWHSAGRSIRSISESIHSKRGLEISKAQLWRQMRKWGLCTTKAQAEVASSIRQAISPAWFPATTSTALPRIEQLTCPSPGPKILGTTSLLVNLTKEDADAIIAQLDNNIPGLTDRLESVEDLSKVEVMEAYSILITESLQANLQSFDDLAATFVEFLRVLDLATLALTIHEIDTIPSHEILAHTTALDSICEGFAMRLNEFFQTTDLEDEEAMVSELTPLVSTIDEALDTDDSVIEFFEHSILLTFDKNNDAESTRNCLLVLAFIVDHCRMAGGKTYVAKNQDDAAADDGSRSFVLSKVCDYLQFLDATKVEEVPDCYAKVLPDKQSIATTLSFVVFLLDALDEVRGRLSDTS